MLRHGSIPTAKMTRRLGIACAVGNGEKVPLQATMSFDPADPVAVTLDIRTASTGTVVWTFARQLLVDGARRAVGEGDVRVEPARSDGRRVLLVSLSSPNGQAALELPRDTVTAFVRETYAAVPATIESDLIDWDAEFRQLLKPDGD